MFHEKSYRSYEEFEREELRPMERLEMGIDDFLGEFDNEDRAAKRARRQGLFDAYDDDDRHELLDE